jgi:hypothetical protein
MHRSAAFGFSILATAVLIGSDALAAQQPAQPAPPSKGIQILVMPPASRCPIAMHARQGSSMQMFRTGDGDSQPLMTPTLTLTPRGQRQIVAATVTAHGHPNEGGTTDLVAHRVDPDHPAGTPEITKTLTIKLIPGERGTVSAELQLSGFTTVQSIELNSVTYDDGSTWKFAAASGCSVAPDPLLLISTR